MNLKYHVLADPLSDQVLAGPVLLSITFRVDGEPFEISDPTLVAKHWLVEHVFEGKLAE